MIAEAPVLILTTGGRSTPAILGALTLQPRAVEFINSQDELYREDEIRKALPSAMVLSDAGIAVPAFDMQKTYEACQTLIARYEHGPFVVNLSSGTKVMALGAYEFAKDQHIPAHYVDTRGKQILDLVTHTEHALNALDVKSYLGCFGRGFLSKFDAEMLSVTVEQAIQAAQKIVEWGDKGQVVLEYIRVNGKGSDAPRTRRIKHYEPTADEEQVWRYFVASGLIGEILVEPNIFKFTIQQHADYAFLEGGWLEIYCWDSIRHQLINDQPLFDDIQLSFEIPSDQHGARKEIDVAAMYENQIILGSCKAGSNKIWSTEHLDELSAVSSLLGGRFCSRIFITSKCPPPAEQRDSYQEYQRFCHQAKDREIVVVHGENLHEIGAIFAQQAKRPTFWRV